MVACSEKVRTRGLQHIAGKSETRLTAKVSRAMSFSRKDAPAEMHVMLRDLRFRGLQYDIAGKSERILRNHGSSKIKGVARPES